MSVVHRALLCLVLPGLAVTMQVHAAAADDLSGSGKLILQQILDADSWGLGDAQIKATALVREPSGSTRTVVFTTESSYYDGHLTRTFLRMLAPPDLNGVRFLQIQKRDSDDERYIFLPELKRVRRVSGALRSGSFMTTGFSYADIDRRELRIADATDLGEAKLGDVVCDHVMVQPRGEDSQYTRLELWARKDNHLVLQMLMYGRNEKLVKTLTVKASELIQKRWFVTRALLENHATGQTTDLSISSIVPRTDFPAETFTRRNLERP